MKAAIAIALLIAGLQCAQAQSVPSLPAPMLEQAVEPPSQQPISSEAANEDQDSNPILALVETYGGLIDVISTFVIAVFTVVLGIATVRMWQSTDKLWREARDSGKTTRQMSVAASEQAALLAKQTDIQAKQHEMARIQHFATHRPHLKIGFVRRDQGTTPTVTFRIVNAGTESAIIKGSSVTLEWMHPDDMPDVDDGEDYPRNDFISRDRFDPGNAQRFTTVSINSVQPGKGALRLYGYVVYADQRERVGKDGAIESPGLRTTYFMRQFNGSTGRFETVADRDYNSED